MDGSVSENGEYPATDEGGNGGHRGVLEKTDGAEGLALGGVHNLHATGAFAREKDGTLTTVTQLHASDRHRRSFLLLGRMEALELVPVIAIEPENDSIVSTGVQDSVQHIQTPNSTVMLGIQISQGIQLLAVHLIPGN